MSFLVKYHYMERQPLDMMLFLRATAAEAAESGLHFYILYQVMSRPGMVPLCCCNCEGHSPEDVFAFCQGPLHQHQARNIMNDSSCVLQFPPTETRPINRQEMLEHLPKDLHKFVIFHNFRDTVNKYPKLAAHIDEGNGGPGPRGVSRPPVLLLTGQVSTLMAEGDGCNQQKPVF